MSPPLLPQDVTEHLEAAIHLSNRHIQVRLLGQAETLISSQFPVAAIAVAGVVLEFLVAGQRDRRDPNEVQQIEKWSQLRNVAVHSHEAIVSLDEARDMVAGVRQLLHGVGIAGPRLSTTKPNVDPERVRGKYKFVPTSSAEFIARKAEELRLAHQ